MTVIDDPTFLTTSDTAFLFATDDAGGDWLLGTPLDEYSPLHVRRKVLAFAAETTPGEAVATSVYNVPILDISLKRDGDFVEQRHPMAHMDSGYMTVIRPRLASLSFTLEVFVNADNTFSTMMATLLSFCGYEAKGTGGSPMGNGFGVRQSPYATGAGTGTFHVYEDGVRKGIRGAMGTFKLRTEAGKRWFFDFNMQGVWIDPSDVAMPSYDPTAPDSVTDFQRLLSKQSTISFSDLSAFDAVATPQLASFKWDAGVTVEPVAAMDDEAGVSHVRVVGHDQRIEFDPESRLVANFDADWFLREGGLIEMSVFLYDNASYATFLNLGSVQIESLKSSDRNNVMIESIVAKPVDPTVVTIDIEGTY